MKKKFWTIGFGCGLLAAGIAAALLTRPAALEGTSGAAQMGFALSLILALVGLLVGLLGFLPERKATDVRTLSLAAIFAALCYVGFTYCRIDIPVGTEKTAFHLGNVFCVLGALFMGGFWGGMAGAVGMTLADLTTAYVTSAPKTFFLKLCIGLITGLIAHKVFAISQERERKISLTAAVAISATGGMAFNMVADPVTGYLYKRFIMGVPQQAASIWAKIGAVTTATNAVVAIVVATVLYMALRASLKKTNLLPHVQ